MTTLDVVPKKKPEPSAEETAAKELVRQAREQGLSLTGPDGLLEQFTKSVLETALNEEMTEHLGYEKHRAAEDRDSTNIRNGTRPKTVLTEATGQIQIDDVHARAGPERRSALRRLVDEPASRVWGVEPVQAQLADAIAPPAATASPGFREELEAATSAGLVELEAAGHLLHSLDVSGKE